MIYNFSNYIFFLYFSNNARSIRRIFNDVKNKGKNYKM